MIWCGPPRPLVVESLLRHGTDGDREQVRAAIQRLAAVPTNPGFVLHEIAVPRLRALQARQDGYRESLRCYREKAASGGFRQHMISVFT